MFLTAKFDRTWKAMTRFRAKVGAPRFREMMDDLAATIEIIGRSDQRRPRQLPGGPSVYRRSLYPPRDDIGTGCQSLPAMAQSAIRGVTTAPSAAANTALNATNPQKLC